MNNKEKIIEFCKNLGLDTLGVTSCRKLEELEEYLISRKNNGLENEFEEKDIEKRREYLSSFIKSITWDSPNRTLIVNLLGS